jgi:hypothetical protein
MKLDSARELKQVLSAQFLSEGTGPVHASALSFGPARSRAAAERPRVMRSVALGLAPKGRKEFRLAVRIQRPGMEESPEVQSIRKQAKGEGISGMSGACKSWPSRGTVHGRGHCG